MLLPDTFAWNATPTPERAEIGDIVKLRPNPSHTTPLKLPSGKEANIVYMLKVVEVFEDMLGGVSILKLEPGVHTLALFHRSQVFEVSRRQ